MCSTYIDNYTRNKKTIIPPVEEGRNLIPRERMLGVKFLLFIPTSPVGRRRRRKAKKKKMDVGDFSIDLIAWSSNPCWVSNDYLQIIQSTHNLEHQLYCGLSLVCIIRNSVYRQDDYTGFSSPIRRRPSPTFDRRSECLMDTYYLGGYDVQEAYTVSRYHPPSKSSKNKTHSRRRGWRGVDGGTSAKEAVNCPVPPPCLSGVQRKG